MDYSYLEFLAEMGIGGAHPGGLQLSREALKKFNINKDSKILDVGCGTGQTAAYISKEYQCNVACIDNNKIMVEKANKRFQESNLPLMCIQECAEALPFEAASFDIVLSESVLVFTKIISSIPEIKRVLKQDGSLLAVEMVLESELTEEEALEVQSFYGFSFIFTEEQWTKEFTSAGFKNVEFEKYAPTQQPGSLDSTPEFHLSEELDDLYFEMLAIHQMLSLKYYDKLGFRIIKCS